jgi:hypothetical protein
MQEHYSSVNPEEQRSALAKVIRLADRAPSGVDGGVAPPSSGVGSKKAG